MVAPVRYLSRREQEQKIGILGYTEQDKVLEVIGRVGIGTTIFDADYNLDVRGNASINRLTVPDFFDTQYVGTINLGVTGTATFSNFADFNGDVDIDGHTELDNLNVSGVSTFTSNVDINASVDISSNLIVGGTFSVSGVSTFSGNIDANGNLDVDGQTDLDVLNVSELATFSGNIDANGNLDVDGHTELDDLNVSGVATFASNIDANGNLDVDGHTELDDLNVSGVATFASNINVQGEIHGPAEFIIDPAAVGDNTGLVRIKGDLYVDGTEFIVNSTTIELADFNVGVATTVGTNLLLDGAGIGIGSTNIRKTLSYDYSSDSLKSSENFDIESGKSYKINEIEVLSSTQLTVPNIYSTGIGTIETLDTTTGTIDYLSNININSSGVITATNFVGDLTGTATTALNLSDAANITTGTISSDRLTGTYNIDISGTATTALNLSDAANITTGTISTDRLTGTYNIDISGNAATATYATNAGLATYATALQTARTFEITGDVVASPISFDGTGNVSLAATIQPNSVELGADTFGDYVATIADSGDTDIVVNNSGTETAAVTLGLTTTGVTAGSYGSSTEIPTFTVDSRGRLTVVGTASVGTALTVAGDSGTEIIDLLSETLTISGGTNLTSSAASNTVTINLDDYISLSGVDVTGVVTSIGGFVGDLTGVATTATALQTPRTFEITGDVVASPISFDGTGNVSLAATIQPNSVELGTDTFGNYVATIADSGSTDIIVNNSGTETAAVTLGLTTTGVIAGSYGSSTEIPTFTVDSRGRLTVAGTASVGTALTVSGDSGSETINLLTETLTISGGTNLTSSAAADTITINLDDNISLTGVNATGVVTASGGFVGDLTGTATTATQLETARTFQITGDVVASSISFDGTGNVSLAATIQPNSVELGADTFGDYVESISGTANQITVTGGTGEGSTPTVSIASNATLPGNVTIANDLQINNNLNVNGNITVGGTTGYILVENFRVSDADIILGFTTDGSGNDVSNDTTANHGGVAVASTEGNPLVSLNIAGIETLPPTYKKIMWFKAGSFAGLGTDAWLSNYAIGIGSTQFPTGTRLAAGSVQFTEYDLAVVRNINASGVITASNFVGSLTGTASTASFATTAFNLNGVIESDLNVAFADTAGIATNLKGGVAGNVPYQSAPDTTAFVSNGTSGQVLLFNGSVPVWGSVSDASGAFGGISVYDEGILIGTANSITTLNFVGDNIQATATTGANGISTITFTDTPTFDSVNVTGVITSTGGFVGDLTGTATTATNLADAANITTGTIDAARLTGTYNIDISGNAATATYATNAGVTTYATALQTARTFEITGDVVASPISFDGTGNVSLAATIQPNSVELGTDTFGNYVATIADSGDTDIVVNNSGTETAAITLGLSTTGVTAGSYGSSTEIPTFTVDSRGRLTAVGTASVGTALTVSGDSGSETINLLTETLTISGGTNLTSSAAADTVTINLDDNISLTGVNATGVVTASGGFVGDLTGTATTATNLADAANITTGTISADRLTGTYNIDISGNAATATYADNAGVSTSVIGGIGSLTSLTVSGISTFTSNIDANGDLDVDGHTELDQLNVSGVSTFVGAVTFNDSIDVDGHTELDNVNVSGVSTFNDIVHVGSAITMYPATGIISATAFYGDGANLDNTGSTLSAATGTQRVVLTSLTSGTMVTSSTDGDLTFNATNNLLAVPNLQATGLTTDGTNFGPSGYVAVSDGAGGWDWGQVSSASGAFGGISVKEEGSVVGTANSITDLNFIGSNITASIVGLNTVNITLSEDPQFNTLSVTGIATFGDQVSAGGTVGTDGQYLQSTGVGVTWASFPTLRTTQTNVATNGQTAFNFSYNINFLDVFVNGVKLTSTEYTATNGSQIVLASPAFGGDIVEFHSYNTISVGGGSGGSGASIMSDLGDVTFSTLSDGQLLQYESTTGQWRNITANYATVEYVGTVPQNAQTSAYVLVASDSGKHISITTGGVTVPQNVFSIGDTIAIYNNSSSSQTITQGTGVTLRFSGTSSTGNRTLDQYGLCSILCVASNTFAISGTGLS